MANVKTKSDKIEAAIQKLITKLPKDLAKRVYTGNAHAALTVFVAQQCGIKADAEAWKALAKELADVDMLYQSAMKKYLVSRGILPAKVEADTTDLVS